MAYINMEQIYEYLLSDLNVKFIYYVSRLGIFKYIHIHDIYLYISKCIKLQAFGHCVM